MNKKAQLHLEFGAGFFLFILVVLYVAFSVINTMPIYYQDLRDDRLRMNAWVLSEKLEKMITNELSELVVCNYEDLKNRFDIGDVNDFHVDIINHPIVITEISDGANPTGQLIINEKTVDFEVKDTDGDEIYETSNIDGTDYIKGQSVTISGENYIVDKIDEEGQFVILSRDLVDCGMRSPEGGNIALTTRYSNFDAHLTKAIVEYW